jgi:hypothetical protein
MPASEPAMLSARSLDTRAGWPDIGDLLDC